MALQLLVQHDGQPVTYQIIAEGESVYRLLLDPAHPDDGTLPAKINIRRKGKLWVSDLEDDNALVQSLMGELIKLNND